MINSGFFTTNGGCSAPTVFCLAGRMVGRRASLMARTSLDQLGADGIVGVHLRMQSYAWGQGVLEFIATDPRDLTEAHLHPGARPIKRANFVRPGTS